MPIINQVVAGGGTTPTGTINITSNGTTDVTQYASANVNVVPALSMQYRNVNGTLQQPNTFIDLTGVTDLSDNVLYSAFYANLLVSSVDCSSLTSVSGSYALSYAFNYSNVVTADFSNLSTVSGDCAFEGTFSGTRINSINFNSLTTISGYRPFSSCFSSCQLLTSLSFPSLSNISGEGAMAYCFESCVNLTTLSFPALTSTSFGSYTNQFDGLMSAVTGCTIHFPSNLQATIATLDGYPDFGGTNTVLAFDLPATE